MVILFNRTVDYGIVLPRVVSELSGAIAVKLNSRTFDHLFIDLLSVLFCFALPCFCFHLRFPQPRLKFWQILDGLLLSIFSIILCNYLLLFVGSEVNLCLYFIVRLFQCVIVVSFL
jgi:hypothetical protein